MSGLFASWSGMERLSLVLWLILAQSYSIKIKECEKHPNCPVRITSINVSACDEASPCVLKTARNYSAVVTFIPDREYSYISNGIFGVVGEEELPIPSIHINACSHGVKCPTVPYQPAMENVTIYLSPRIPPHNDAIGEWMLSNKPEFDKRYSIGCAQFTVSVQ